LAATGPALSLFGGGGGGAAASSRRAVLAGGGPVTEGGVSLVRSRFCFMVIASIRTYLEIFLHAMTQVW